MHNALLTASTRAPSAVLTANTLPACLSVCLQGGWGRGGVECVCMNRHQTWTVHTRAGQMPPQSRLFVRRAQLWLLDARTKKETLPRRRRRRRCVFVSLAVSEPSPFVRTCARTRHKHESKKRSVRVCSTCCIRVVPISRSRTKTRALVVVRRATDVCPAVARRLRPRVCARNHDSK